MLAALSRIRDGYLKEGAAVNTEALSKTEREIHETRQKVGYLGDQLHKINVRRLGQGVNIMNLESGPNSPVPGSMRPRSTDLRNEIDGPPTPPPKDAMSTWSDTATLNSQNYAMNASVQTGLHSPSSYSESLVDASLVKPRPNFTKLGTYAQTTALSVYFICLNF